MTSINDYYKLRPAEYGSIVVVEFMQFETSDRAVQQDLRVVLSKSPKLSGPRLILTFRGVRQVEFHQPDLSLASFGLVEITECDGEFRVAEDEGQLKFFCMTFDATPEYPDLSTIA